MKKILLVAAVSMLALASCKKDYTCTCVTLGITNDNIIKDASKSDAKSACETLSAQNALLGGSCELK